MIWIIQDAGFYLCTKFMDIESLALDTIFMPMVARVTVSGRSAVW